VAARLTTAVRTDDIVARLGGDEFAILVNNTTDAQCIQIITKRVFNAFSAPFEIEGIEIAVKASIGVAVARPDEHDAQAFLERADRAMYHVKRPAVTAISFRWMTGWCQMMSRLQAGLQVCSSKLAKSISRFTGVFNEWFQPPVYDDEARTAVAAGNHIDDHALEACRQSA